MLVADGYRVLLGVRRPQDAPRLAGGEAEVIDVASTDSIGRLIERLTHRRERLEVLVNNAGIYRGSPSAIWAVNVRGPLLLTRGLSRVLEDGARVVLVSSGLAQGAASRSLRQRLDSLSLGNDSCDRLCDDAPGAYGASKAALNRLAQLFAAEFASRRIKVNAVSPGWCRTDMGGRGAPRSVDQGAESLRWGYLLGAEGPSGGFFEDGHPLSDCTSAGLAP
jgi:NAD(P)-dependent dehydrogenase (short-subunit alcohol dehydrogenase family)